jgi:hypothetical protein
MNMLIKLITDVFNIVHLIGLFLPFLLVLIPTRFFLNIELTMKCLALFYLLIPLHWVFFDDKCVFTMLSVKLGDYKGTNDSIAFTEANLRPLYEPIMKKIKLNWENRKDIDKMINIHWIMIFIIMWYILAFKLC